MKREKSERLRILRYYFIKWIPDGIYLRLRYFTVFKKWPNLRNPKKLSEKLQWMKLNFRNPSQIDLMDKITVKNFIIDKIGEEHIIKTIGCWDQFDEINFNELPNQFVLKCNHDSGSVTICEDKTAMDMDKVKERLNFFVNRNYFWEAREWGYKNIKPKIMAEELLVDSKGEAVSDHKFYCFHGEPKLYMAATIKDKTTQEEVYDFFDENGNYLPIEDHEDPDHKIPNLPKNFEKMLKITKTLSEDLPFVRVDLYEAGEKVYFGELTFYPDAGFDNEFTEDWDLKLGEWIDLERISKR